MTTHTPTVEQQTLIDRISAMLHDEPRVGATWLSGSLGKGQGDAFSDVDVLVAVPDGAAAAVSTDLAQRLSEVAVPVLVNVLFGGRVLNVVTESWQRFDISFTEEKELGFHDAAALTTLFNRAGHVVTAKPQSPYRTTPDTLRKLVDEFLRVCGLSVVGEGRREYVLMLWGNQLLRQMTMDLMLEENGVSPAARGGALHRNPFLTDEQREALENVPPMAANRDSVLAAQGYLMSVFLPRAKRLAADIAMEWPAAFEEATRRHLEAKLGLAWPSS
jgi:predicted nucleotidyltransferase